MLLARLLQLQRCGMRSAPRVARAWKGLAWCRALARNCAADDLPPATVRYWNRPALCLAPPCCRSSCCISCCPPVCWLAAWPQLFQARHRGRRDRLASGFPARATPSRLCLLVLAAAAGWEIAVVVVVLQSVGGTDRHAGPIYVGARAQVCFPQALKSRVQVAQVTQAWLFSGYCKSSKLSTSPI